MRKPLLKVDHLTFGYDVTVLKDLTLEVFAGDILLINGENGVGKTTLLKCIAGILNAGKEIYLDGKDIFSHREELKKIAFVMSEDFLYDYMTVSENLTFFKAIFEEGPDFDKNIQFYFSKFHLDHIENVLVKHLSQGMRNKVFLAIMFSKNHKILILDEPFTALDKETQACVLQVVEEYKEYTDRCALIVTHIDEFKKVATREIMLDNQNRMAL